MAHDVNLRGSGREARSKHRWGVPSHLSGLDLGRVSCGAVSMLSLGLLLALATPAAAEEPKPAPTPRAEMDKVFEAVTHLLPLAMDGDAWADPAMRNDIMRWIKQLDSRTDMLISHSEKRDAGFRNLSRSLASDVSEVRVRYELGQFEESRYFMMETTGNCVACHSRMPNKRRFALAGKLLDKIDLDSLEPHERAHLLVITRQFDKALSAWETAFADTSVPPAQLAASGALLDYLIIGVRVQRETDRAVRTLRTFLLREDTPRYVRRDVESWLVALEASKAELDRKPDLDRARMLVNGEIGPRPGLFGKEQTVYDLVASSVLLQLLDGSKAGDPKSAEAFYLLGLVEARSIDSYWVPQAEFHLEQAIRLAPNAPFAVDAYAALEECVAVGYGGALGGDLPTDIELRLKELRALVDGLPPAETEVNETKDVD